jgi:hypothetical protein
MYIYLYIYMYIYIYIYVYIYMYIYMQVQLFGKVVFLTVYGLVLTFLFLPTSLVEGDLATRLARTYVLTEKEKKSVEKSRRLFIKNVRTS